MDKYQEEQISEIEALNSIYVDEISSKYAYYAYPSIMSFDLSLPINFNIHQSQADFTFQLEFEMTDASSIYMSTKILSIS